jgi:hypothetical protein
VENYFTDSQLVEVPAMYGSIVAVNFVEDYMEETFEVLPVKKCQ